METTSNILSTILEVFTQVGNWISQSVTSLMPMFYTAEDGLTFVGVLAVAGLAFSIVFLNSLGHNVSDNVSESALTAGKSFF